MKKYNVAVLATLAAFLFTAPAMADSHPEPQPAVTVSGGASQESGGITFANHGNMNGATASFDQGSGANYMVGGSNVVGAAGVGSMSGVQVNVGTTGNTHVSSAFGGTSNYAGAMTIGSGCDTHANTSISGSGSVQTGTVASIGMNSGGSTNNGAYGSTATNGNFSYSADPHNSVSGQGLTVGGGVSTVTNTGNGFVVTTHAGSLSEGSVTGSAHMPH